MKNCFEWTYFNKICKKHYDSYSTIRTRLEYIVQLKLFSQIMIYVRKFISRLINDRSTVVAIWDI